MFHLWRVNDYRTVETFGDTFLALPYWLVDDLKTLKHAMIWHTYDQTLEAPPPPGYAAKPFGTEDD